MSSKKDIKYIVLSREMPSKLLQFESVHANKLFFKDGKNFFLDVVFVCYFVKK
jgi:hypothetical protein